MDVVSSKHEVKKAKIEPNGTSCRNKAAACGRPPFPPGSSFGYFEIPSIRMAHYFLWGSHGEPETSRGQHEYQTDRQRTPDASTTQRNTVYSSPEDPSQADGPYPGRPYSI